MNRLYKKLENKERRASKVRSKVVGSSVRPRLSVFISNKHISAQIIDDEKNITIVGVSTVSDDSKGTMTEKAVKVGQEIAKKAKAKKVKQVAFDRGSKLYHGRIKALADAARKEGLEF